MHRVPCLRLSFSPGGATRGSFRCRSKFNRELVDVLAKFREVSAFVNQAHCGLRIHVSLRSTLSIAAKLPLCVFFTIQEQNEGRTCLL